MIRKNKIICVTIGIVFASLLIINSNPIFTAVNKESDFSNVINFNDENLKISKVSGKIHIYNNWTDAVTAGICTGSGTYSDPYVIEDLVIDGGGSGTGIWIQFSSVYFKVENCTVYNSFIGIDIYSCDNNIVTGNNASYNDYGIQVEDCNNCIISENTVSYNSDTGMSMIGDNNTFVKNTANHNNNSGMGLGGNYSIISENIASYNKVVGISIGGDNNNVSRNTACNNGGYGTGLYGIELSGNNNILSLNNITGNSRMGMYLGDFNNNTISGNNVNSNGEVGIELFYGNNNTISGNTIFNNTAGILIHAGGHDNLIFNNTFINNLDANAEDNGNNNQWDNGTIGNYWSDYPGVDANDDGIGDTSYDITGTASSQDNFPIWDDGPEFKIPGYNLFVLIGILSVVTILVSKKLKKS